MWQIRNLKKEAKVDLKVKTADLIIVSFFSFLSLSLNLSSGCGYHLVEYDRSSSLQSKRIAIPTFYNDTFEPLIERKITGFIKEEFVSRGSLQIVNDPAMADLTLTGRITGFRLIPISFTKDSRVREYRVSIAVDIDLIDKTGNPNQKDKRYILTEKGREVTAEYLVTDDLSANRAAEDRAIEEAERLFAEDLVSQILEGL